MALALGLRDPLPTVRVPVPEYDARAVRVRPRRGAAMVEHEAILSVVRELMVLVVLVVVVVWVAYRIAREDCR